MTQRKDHVDPERRERHNTLSEQLLGAKLFLLGQLGHFHRARADEV